MDAERWLRVMLRVGAVATLAAFPTALLPTDTMVAVHAKLGLGELDAGPIHQYMARSLSLLYGFHGALLMLLSFRVRQLLPVVTYVGWMNVLFGAGMLAIDLHAGLPWWWTAGEGPGIAAMGLVLLCLRAKVSAAD